MRYDLRFAFLLMTNLCVLAWACASGEPTAFLAFGVIATVTSATYGVAKGRSPFKPALIAGRLAGVALALYVGPISALVYLAFHVPSVPYQVYFEDGALFDFVFVPIIGSMVYAPTRALLGLFSATVVYLIRQFAISRRIPRTRISAPQPG
jgi:hypothetical protein